MSIKLTGCHHIVHVELLPGLLHYDCCSYCRRELDLYDKMFLLQILQRQGFFNLGQGNYSCPDNHPKFFIPQRTGSPTDFSDGEMPPVEPLVEPLAVPHAEPHGWDAESLASTLPNGLDDGWDAESLASTLEIDTLEEDDDIEILYERIG